MAVMGSFLGSSLYRVLTLAAQLAVTVLITRLTGAEGFGLYSLIVVNAGLLHLFTSLGIPSGITHHAASGLTSIGGLRKVIILSTLAQLILVLVVEVFTWKATGHGFIWPETGTLAILFGVLFFLSVSLNEKYAAVLLGRHRQTDVNRIAFVFTTASALALLSWHLVSGKSDLRIVITLLVLFACAQVVRLAFPVYAVTSPKAVAADDGGVDWKALLGYSVVNYLANAVQFLAYRVDYWILDHYHGNGSLGIYALAVRMAQLLWVLPAVAASILFPLGSAGRADKELVGLVLRVVMALGLISIAAMAVLASWVLPAFFGGAFAASVRPFWILLPGVLLFTINMVLAAWFAGTGRPRYNMWMSLASFIIILLLDLAWIPGHGAAGAAAASTVAYTSSAVMAVWLFLRDDKPGRLRIWPTGADMRSLLALLKKNDKD